MTLITGMTTWNTEAASVMRALDFLVGLLRNLHAINKMGQNDFISFVLTILHPLAPMAPGVPIIATFLKPGITHLGHLVVQFCQMVFVWGRGRPLGYQKVIGVDTIHLCWVSRNVFCGHSRLHVTLNTKTESVQTRLGIKDIIC